MEIVKRLNWKRLNWWGFFAGLSLLLPAFVLWLLDVDSTRESLLTQLTWALLIGLVLTGLGNVMRAAAHNRDKTIDGIGKLVGLAGWAVSLIAVVVFAAERGALLGTPVLGVFTQTSFWLGLVVAVGSAASSVLPPRAAADI